MRTRLVRGPLCTSTTAVFSNPGRNPVDDGSVCWDLADEVTIAGRASVVVKLDDAGGVELGSAEGVELDDAEGVGLDDAEGAEFDDAEGAEFDNAEGAESRWSSV